MRFIILLILTFLSQIAEAKNPELLRTYGDSSPVQMYLFSSLACPHCATFHQELLPLIKSKYVSSKKAQIILVDMPNDETTLQAYTLLRCADDVHKGPLEKALYKSQRDWVYQEDIAPSYLLNLALKNGFTQAQFNHCTQNEGLRKTIQQQQKSLVSTYGIKHMPTLLIRQGNNVMSWEGTDKDEILSGLKDFFDSTNSM